MIKEFKYYLDKIEPCNIFDDNGRVSLYFHHMQSKACYILLEFSNCADEFKIVKNDLLDDPTINYVIVFDKKRIDDIAFVDYCFTKNQKICGVAVYDIPMLEYWLSLECESPPNYMKMYVSDEEKEYRHYILQQLYRAYNQPLNFKQLPYCMTYTSKTGIMQNISLNKFLSDNHPVYIERNSLAYSEKSSKSQGNRFFCMLNEFKRKYDSIYQNLIDCGKCSPKWKSEYELFILVRSVYPDAVYQYRDDWLGRQSLDVYVPSMRIGFEYQGMQHYQPVNVFGGEDHFVRQITLDKRKRTLCKDNDVFLIEWKYDEPISKIVLKKKISSI